MTKITFTKSPIGFGLGYAVGESGEFNDIQAKELIDSDFAVLYKQSNLDTIEKADSIKPKTEKAVKK